MSVPVTQKALYLCFKGQELALFREIIQIYCEALNILCGQCEVHSDKHVVRTITLHISYI